MQKICEKEVLVFDYEVLKHWWCVVFKIPGGKRTIITSETFKITDKYDLIIKSILVGFNIKNYDLKILSAIMNNYPPERVFELSNNIITEKEDILNNISFWNKYLFIDLYDDWRNGSLKEYESNKGLSIMESSVPFDKEDLTEEDKQELIKYCIHDVDATEQLLLDRTEYIQSKLELAKMFNISPYRALKCTNAKLCSIILKAYFIEREPNNIYVLPDKIRNYVYENLPQSVISQFFELNSENKEVELFENTIVFGIGGIHSTCGDDIYTSADENYALINVDVTSYYPNLIMHFGYMSRNATTPEVYEKIYHLRTTIKKQAKQELNENGKTEKYYQLHYLQNGLKLILNTTYGATKNKYNALYDEYQASSLCYTGQLLLASLANKLYNSIKNLTIIQTNTDGILVKCPRDNIKLLETIVHEWETMCGFYMEFDYIDSFLQRNVNNYIENTGNENDPYKLKGKWANQALDATIEANLNAPIVHKAVLLYYTEHVPIEKTINECNDILKFCFTTKTGHTYDNTYYMYDGKLTKTNKVNRVVATTDQKCGTIYKYKKDSEQLLTPNPFAEDYKTQLSNYNKKIKKINIFEEQYGIPYGRLDKAAEIPEHSKLLNDDLSLIPDLDRNWYIDTAKKRVEQLRVI